MDSYTVLYCDKEYKNIVADDITLKPEYNLLVFSLENVVVATFRNWDGYYKEENK